ncbi:hypothetical protein LEN26_007991 [Aphanomyces euteiches]|nr:hypothetical protein LEN26_007991 [Aphanomyces euteiches]
MDDSINPLQPSVSSSTFETPTTILSLLGEETTLLSSEREFPFTELAKPPSRDPNRIVSTEDETYRLDRVNQLQNASTHPYLPKIERSKLCNRRRRTNSDTRYSLTRKLGPLSSANALEKIMSPMDARRSSRHLRGRRNSVCIGAGTYFGQRSHGYKVRQGPMGSFEVKSLPQEFLKSLESMEDLPPPSCIDTTPVSWAVQETGNLKESFQVMSTSEQKQPPQAIISSAVCSPGKTVQPQAFRTIYHVESNTVNADDRFDAASPSDISAVA